MEKGNSNIKKLSNIIMFSHCSLIVSQVWFLGHPIQAVSSVYLSASSTHTGPASGRLLCASEARVPHLCDGLAPCSRGHGAHAVRPLSGGTWCRVSPNAGGGGQGPRQGEQGMLSSPPSRKLPAEQSGQHCPGIRIG